MSVVDGLRWVFAFLSISMAMVCQQYRANLEVDNKISSHAPSSTLHAVSFATCSRSCVNGCECFSFNTQSKMCSLNKLYSACDPSNMTVIEEGWRSFIQRPATMPQNCKEIFRRGTIISGVYTIYPWEKSNPNYRPVQVYCDMITEGGGWTAIQRRVNGEESFNRNWTDYKRGFGSPHGDYWIGNDAIHQLTKGRNSRLVVTINLRQSNLTLYQVYGQFSVCSEDQNYKLNLANPGNGSLDDGMLHPSSIYNLTGMQFSTFDADHDMTRDNCAATYEGGWWFNACHGAFLNGPWLPEHWTDP